MAEDEAARFLAAIAAAEGLVLDVHPGWTRAAIKHFVGHRLPPEKAERYLIVLEARQAAGQPLLRST
jgi:hypothetical protein